MLLEELEREGLYWLIPKHIEKINGEYISEELALEMYPDDVYEGAEPDTEYDREKELEMFYQGEVKETEDESMFATLDELKVAFDLAYEDDEVVENMHPWDLFGLTATQFHKFLDLREADLWDLDKLLEILRNKEYYTSPEQRCKVAVVYATTKIKFPYNPEDRKYYEKIMLTYDAAEASRLIQFVSDYQDDYSYLRVHGVDVSHYPKRPKLGTIQDMHNRIMRERAEWDREHGNADQETYIFDFEQKAQLETYTHYFYENEYYKVCPVKHPYDLVREGRELDHCVADYIGKHATGESDIYFIRRKSALDVPYFTVELQFNAGNSRTEMTQCYGYEDCLPTEPLLLNFLREWMDAKNIKNAFRGI